MIRPAPGAAVTPRPRRISRPASAIYALAALDLGLAYVNFTPSLGSDLPALDALARARGAVHAGADGKTGQTLLKTVLAPMFAIRRLAVKSWVSHNLLGNADGRALDDPERRASKQRSKGAALGAILGYEPEHKVGIEYVPSYGDWKLAWDRIVFAGFGGAEMTLELTWRGSDTALAAPLCIDLIRLVELAQRRGEVGVLPHLAVFFKKPLGTDEHKPHLTDAPWIVVLFAQTHGVRSDGSKRTHYYVPESCGIAAGLFIAAVHRMGLVTLTHTPSPMVFLRELLGRPANEKALLVMPVGYPAPGAKVPDLSRKALDEIAVWK